MAEYTKQIKQLTQQASQTPQFQAPSQSLGGDIVNALGTGLQFLQQKQATEKLEEVRTLQSQQERRMSTGVLGLRELRQNLSNQGVSKTLFMQKEREYLAQFNPEERVGIIQQTKEVTGKSLASFSSDLDKQAQDAIAARTTLEEEAAGLRPYMTQPLDLGADDNVIQAQILQATANKAQMEKLKAEETLKSTQLSNQQTANTINARNYLIEYGVQVGNQMVQQVQGLLDTVDFNNTAQVEETMKLVGSRRQEFIVAAVQDAASKGITISQQEAETQLSAQLTEFDNVQRLLGREDIASMTANQRKYMVNNMVLGLKQDSSYEAQKLSYFLTWSDVLENNPYLQQDLAAQQISTLVGGMATKKFGATPFNDTDAPDPKKAASAFMKNVFMKAPSDLTQEERNVFTDTVVEDLTAGVKGTERLVNNGGLTAYVEGIALGKSDNLIPEERKGEVLEGLLDKSEVFLRRAIPDVLRNQQLGSVKPSGRGIKQRKGPVVESGSGESMFDMLGDDLKVKIDGKTTYLSDTARKYNKWVDNVFTAMDKLGATEEEKNALKFQIRRSFNVADNVRESSTSDEYSVLASEQGVDLSSFEDGEYEDANGNTVVIRNGQVVSVQ